VCPWNVRFSRDISLPALAPLRTPANPDLADLLALDDAAFRERFRGTAVTRAKRAGLARNAAVAMGNRRDPADIAPLATALRSDPEPLVRAHAAWALGRHAEDADARAALADAAANEADEHVVAEIGAARGASA
jgi:epoxyqueuosine reductase